MNLAIDGDTGTEKREMRVNIMNEGDGGWEKKTKAGRGCEPAVSRRGREEELARIPASLL